MGPFNAFTRLQMVSSGKFFPFPSAFMMASRREVNSCPLGTPRNLMPVGSPFFSKENSSSFPSLIWQDILSEHSATSANISVNS